MPITTQVTTSNTPGGVSVVYEMEDVPPGPKEDFTAHVVFVAEGEHVTLGAVNPAPKMKKTTGGEIELWWLIDFMNTAAGIPVKVELLCNNSAFGPTHYAWTVTSITPAQPKFSADLGVYYHSPHSCG